MKQIQVISGGEADLIENEAVNLYTDTSNPTTGDSTLDIYLTYRIITL